MKENKSSDVETKVLTQEEEIKLPDIRLVQEETYNIPCKGTGYLRTFTDGDNIINEWDFVPSEDEDEDERTSDDDYFPENF